MTTVTLSGLINSRNESLRVAKLSIFAKVRHRLGRLSLAPARRVLLIIVLSIAGFAARHGLPLAGCICIVTGAATLSITAGWITAGVACFFLELRRR